MTALLALVLAALVLAALTLVRPNRHKEKPAMRHRIEHPNAAPDASSSVLPDGYDDPDGLAYVPDSLRPWWPVDDLDRLEEREALSHHERRARVDVVRLTDPSRFYGAMREARVDVDSRPLSDVESALWGAQTVSLPPLDAAGVARAVHLELLERAARAARSSVQAENAAAMREAYRCKACRGPKPTIAAPLCDPCESVATLLRVEWRGADVLDDGRTRRDAVASRLRGSAPAARDAAGG